MPKALSASPSTSRKVRKVHGSGVGEKVEEEMRNIKLVAAAFVLCSPLF